MAKNKDKALDRPTIGPSPERRMVNGRALRFLKSCEVYDWYEMTWDSGSALYKIEKGMGIAAVERRFNATVVGKPEKVDRGAHETGGEVVRLTLDSKAMVENTHTTAKGKLGKTLGF